MADEQLRDGITLHVGDCLDVLRTLPAASIDAVVTDPPYGLSELRPAQVVTALGQWLAGDRDHVPDARGFMGRAWDGFVPPPAVWDECLRVLKPGSHLLAFAGSRTVDLMGMSIRLAGFEIRDTITWHFGSGFPKSLDVSKAIDRAAGATREVVGDRLLPDGRPVRDVRGVGNHAGWDRPWKSDDAAREANLTVTAPATDDARRWAGWGTALKPASEPIVVARKPLAGTVAQNVLAHGTGALNIDGCRVATTDRWAATGIKSAPGAALAGSVDGSLNVSVSSTHKLGRWPSNVVFSHAATPDGEDLCPNGCVPGCPVAGLDAQSGATYGDSGSASRFFPTFRYQAKASTRERPRTTQPGDGDGRGYRTKIRRCNLCNTPSPGSGDMRCDHDDWRWEPTTDDRSDTVSHPTVKPVDLMRWLVRLVTPKGGTVLEPFAGSGTTVEACALEGFGCIAVERDPAYTPLIRKRLERPGGVHNPKPRPAAAGQLDLFASLDERTPDL